MRPLGAGQKAHRGQLGGGRRLLEMRSVSFAGLQVSQIYFHINFPLLGYTAEHFKNDRDWEVRRMLEFSRAIKCPNINSQLAGFKKVKDD